jgi:RimJ/RimL family protein N-acetyltransferase
MIAPVLQGGRVRLRPHRADDFERLAELFASPRSKYMDEAKSRAEVWKNFRLMPGNGRCLVLALGLSTK